MRVRICLVVGILFAVTFCAHGQQSHFEASDGIWEKPSNWFEGYVPSISNSVIVTYGRTARITQPGATCTNIAVGYSAGEAGTVCLATGTFYTATYQIYGNGGSGTFVQSDGTTNQFGTSLTIGDGSTGNGRYELQGGFLSATGSLSADIKAGNSGTGIFYQTGGTIGCLNVDKSLFVGKGTGSSGAYVMNGGEIVFTNKNFISVGYNGVGSFIQSNGTITVQSPTTFTAVFGVGKDAGGRGTCRLVGGRINAQQYTVGEAATAQGTVYIEGGVLAAGKAFDVGYNGTGTVWQSGGVVIVTNEYIYIGRAGGSKGSYVMTGGEIALTNAANYLFVGEFGNGSFLQSNGTIRVKYYLSVSRKTGSTGIYRMAGGSLTVDTLLQLCEQAGTSARFEVIGTNGLINAKAFSMTTNAVLRFEIASGGVSKIAVQNTATLAGKLEVAVPQKMFNQPVTILSMGGSRSGTFNSVVPIFPLRAVDITYPSGAGNVVLSNFRYYTGTMIAVR